MVKGVGSLLINVDGRMANNELKAMNDDKLIIKKVKNGRWMIKEAVCKMNNAQRWIMKKGWVMTQDTG